MVTIPRNQPAAPERALVANIEEIPAPAVAELPLVNFNDGVEEHNLLEDIDRLVEFYERPNW